MHNDKSVPPTRAGVARRAFLKAGVGVAAGGVLLATDTKALAQGGAGPRQQFAGIRNRENQHVAIVQQTITNLGGTPRPKPTFQNLNPANIATFVQLAQTFENTGTGAYFGAAPYIFNPNVLLTATSIALIEARQAGFLNSYRQAVLTANVTIPDQMTEQPLDQATVQQRVAPFIASLNGGPPIGFSTTPSATNDINILNFALVLEYLETEFYNQGVPVFFGI